MSTPIEPLYRKRVAYQAMLLGGFSTFATIILVMGNMSTREPILERQREDLLVSLNQVIPAHIYSNNLLDSSLQMTGPEGRPITVYRGTQSNRVSALAWEVTGQGYAGEMRFIMGLDSSARILGVRVLSHAETPGLGDKMELAKDDWILDFDGRSLGNPQAAQWKVKKDGGQFDAFTGATITPRGVVAAVLSGLNFFRLHRDELLALVQAEPMPVINPEPTANLKLNPEAETASTKGVNTYE